jgi:hypothetical protein
MMRGVPPDTEGAASSHDGVARTKRLMGSCMRVFALERMVSPPKMRV